MRGHGTWLIIIGWPILVALLLGTAASLGARQYADAFIRGVCALTVLICLLINYRTRRTLRELERARKDLSQ